MDRIPTLKAVFTKKVLLQLQNASTINDGSSIDFMSEEKALH
jgi:hypothetical protein